MSEYREKLGDFRENVVDFAKEFNQEAPTPSKVQIIVLAVMAIPAMFLRQYFVAFALMIMVTLVSLMTNRFELGRFGIELATFSSITMATIFPPRIAAVLGFTYIILQIFTGSTPGVYLIWVIPTYTVVSYIVAGMQVSNIAQIGIYATLISQSFFATMTFLTSRSRLPKYLQYATFNLAFNILLFQSFAQPLLDIINA